MTHASAVRSARIRTIMQHVPSVKSRDELFLWIKARYGVTNGTANDYINTIIATTERMQKK